MLTSKTVVLNLDHYTLLRDAVLSVKGVPMFYTPILYYPTKREDRATGFLLPSYGSSTVRGHSLYNAFFWAIDRSQDATFLYDWFSRAGQGAGTEYRYNFGGGSDGNFRTYLLDESLTPESGSTDSPSSTRSYELRGGANQLLPRGLRARARVDTEHRRYGRSANINDDNQQFRRQHRRRVEHVAQCHRSHRYFYLPRTGYHHGWPRGVLQRAAAVGLAALFSLGTEYGLAGTARTP